MTTIRLTGPLPSASAQERLALFPGRALGEDEFDRLQRYEDGRLAPLLVGQGPGIASGLEVRLGASGGADFVIEPGVAIARDGLVLALDAELRPRWCDVRLAGSATARGPRLVPLPPSEATELGESGAATAADGFYLIALERLREERISASNDPERRTELDPLLDRQRQLVAQVVAHPVTIPGATLATAPRLAANRACALLLPQLGDAGSPLAAIEHQAIVLVLVALQGKAVSWADARAVRRGLGPSASGRALADSTRAAMEAALRELPPSTPESGLAAAFAGACTLDFLPPAGQLPGIALSDAARVPTGGDPGPRLPFLEPHLGLELVPVRWSDVPALLEAELARAPFERTRPTGERLRLLLAVRDGDYRRDLFDVPAIDPTVLDSLHRSWVVALEGWVAWKQARNLRDFVTLDAAGNTLLPGEPKVTLNADQRAALGLSQPDAPQPRPEGPAPDAGGLGLVAGILARERAETEANGEPELPRPYNDVPALAVYATWAALESNASYRNRGTSAVAAATAASADTGIPLGTIPELALMRRYRAALLADEAEVERLVEGLRDHLHEHRQQLDAHTVNLAALAGGVASDGSGMKIARWLPYVNFAAKPALTRQATLIDPNAPEAARSFVPSASASAGAALTDIAAGGSSSIGALHSARPVQSSNTLLVSAAANVLPEKELSSNHLAQLVQGFNAVDLAVNSDRAPIKPPAYEAPEVSFGVMQHLRPDVYLLDKSIATYGELFRRLEAQLERAAPQWKTAFASNALDQQRQLRPASKKLEQLRLEAIQREFDETSDEKEDATAKSYRKSVFLGQRHVDLIENAEGERAVWERVLRALVAEVDRVADRIDELDALLPERHRALAAARSALDEALDDYAMAQRLLIDDWARVERLDEQRTFALTHPLGLWFVRARRAGLGVFAPDPLELRQQAAGDVVPGCGEDHDDFPELLDQFLDLVREAPLAAFRGFVPLVEALPEPARLQLLASARGARLAAKYAGEVRAVPRMAPLLESRAGLLSGLRALVLVVAASAAETRRRALLSLSMEDLLAGPPSAARREAERARAAWEQAAGCLVAGLRRVPAGIRYSWAQLAEDDRLPLAQPGLWPGLAQAEEAVGTAAARTLVELVVWMFRQLAPEESDAAERAVRLLLRACLIHVAHGEAGELLTGRITLAAPRLVTGVTLRAELSRDARPGTRLHLLDTQRRIVGTVRVDDRDDRGTVVRLIERQVDVEPTTAFTLAAIRGGG
ncbi:MAG TPA: hypothetical protein VFS67_36675 [Polyangiaceae bacterium]|nr:hypothetical protein [Polyangiaceae bacterium]